MVKSWNMGCSFSIIFALIGLYKGGLGGAFGGFLLGALIDGLFNRKRASKKKHYYQSTDFTEHELHLAAYVAKADNNRLLRSEMEYVRNFLVRNLGSKRAQEALLRFRDILNSDTDIRPICANLNQHATINEKVVILHFLFGFSSADGDMRQEELNAIWEISQMIGINRSTYEAIKSMFTGYNWGGYNGQQSYGGDSSSTFASRTASDSDYKILEISPDASDNEIKKAYRAAAKKHHPDKVSHLGEDVQKAAEAKFAQVNEAYERIKKARGIN